MFEALCKNELLRRFLLISLTRHHPTTLDRREGVTLLQVLAILRHFRLTQHARDALLATCRTVLQANDLHRLAFIDRSQFFYKRDVIIFFRLLLLGFVTSINLATTGLSILGNGIAMAGGMCFRYMRQHCFQTAR